MSSRVRCAAPLSPPFRARFGSWESDSLSAVTVATDGQSTAPGRRMSGSHRACPHSFLPSFSTPDPLSSSPTSVASHAVRESCTASRSFPSPSPHPHPLSLCHYAR